MSYVYFSKASLYTDLPENPRPLWEVGTFGPDGKFLTESIWVHHMAAKEQVSWLNGGKSPSREQSKHLYLVGDEKSVGDYL